MNVIGRANRFRWAERPGPKSQRRALIEAKIGSTRMIDSPCVLLIYRLKRRTYSKDQASPQHLRNLGQRIDFDMASEDAGNYAQTLDQAVGYGVVGESHHDRVGPAVPS